jgi:hypothetical protein
VFYYCPYAIFSSLLLLPFTLVHQPLPTGSSNITDLFESLLRLPPVYYLDVPKTALKIMWFPLEPRYSTSITQPPNSLSGMCYFPLRHSHPIQGRHRLFWQNYVAFFAFNPIVVLAPKLSPPAILVDPLSSCERREDRELIPGTYRRIRRR